MFNYQWGLHSISASTHLAKFCFTSVSTCNNWWVWILHGYRYNLQYRIRRIESGIFVHLLALQLLIPPIMTRLQNLPWHLLQHRLSPLLSMVCHFVDDKHLTKFSIAFNGCYHIAAKICHMRFQRHNDIRNRNIDINRLLMREKEGIYGTKRGIYGTKFPCLGDNWRHYDAKVTWDISRS